MSTHCYLAFYEKDNEKDINNYTSLIFQHYDGYPDGQNGMENILKEIFGFKHIEFENLSAVYLYKRMSLQQYSVYDSFSIVNDFKISAGYLYKIFPNYFEIFENQANSWKFLKKVKHSLKRGSSNFTLKSTLNFGKYNGKTVSEVIKSDVRYLEWCIKNIEWFKMNNKLKEKIKNLAFEKSKMLDDQLYNSSYLDQDDGNPYNLSIMDYGYDGDGIF